ncbi:MAG: CidA/LrgA family protein [Cocleimonas sp.]
MSASKSNGIKFLFGITALLCFQLLGEFSVHLLKLPLPGPVAGLIFLLIFLTILGRSKSNKRQQALSTIEQSSSALLNHLSLLFVPAGVGVMVHFDKLANEWLAISVALIFGVLITLATTAFCMKITMRLMRINLTPTDHEVVKANVTDTVKK